jgi:hypothetical protein
MRLHHLAFAALTTLSLIGCTVPTASSDTPKTPTTEPSVSQPAVSQPVAPAPVATAAPPAQDAQTPAAVGTDTMDNKDATKKTSGLDASNPSRSCRTDSDCAVKDVGNCCGAYPMCVNKDARTDPAAVRAQCEKDGMASICGFQEVSGCQCVKGQCENITDGSAVM